MADLMIENLCAGYGGRPVLSGVNLTARAGEVTVLLGLNGSGKSTLLRAALGLIPASDGCVTLDGQNLLAMRERERACCAAYIPQRSRMDDGMTVLEAVLMGAHAKTPLFAPYSCAQKKRAAECLDQLGARDWAQRLMGELSEGQKQTVIFARAMMQNARVLMLDEPDGALDLPRRYAMLEMVRKLAQDTPCAALAALHDASLALTRGDRVLVLTDGKIGAELDMRKAELCEVEAAMRMLYGEVRVVRDGRDYAVLG